MSIPRVALDNETNDMSEPLAELQKLRARIASHGKQGTKLRTALHNEARALVRDLETDGDILARTQWGVSSA